MNTRIPQDFIQELIIRTNIVELINSRIKLEKKGENYYSLCPFHDEKTPSFSVNVKKQFFYCFGCKENGNVIDFLMNYEKLSFIESIKELSEKNGLKLPFQRKKIFFDKSYLLKKNIHFVLEKISFLYKKNIFLTQFKNIYNYLLNRGLSKKTIKRFSIGYAGNKKCFLSEHFKQYEEYLTPSGMIIESKEKMYDRFYRRITFPIQDKKGKINGFGGRNIFNNFPKYINSPETSVFHKKNNLYGIYQIYKKTKNPKYVLVVEGYMDVIMLSQFNINYSISLLGTAISNFQITNLFEVTKKIIYCFDGDKAGQEAIWKALMLTLPYLTDEKTVKFILLPENEDPDSIIRKEGEKKFKKRIKNALSISKYLFQKLLNNKKIISMEEKIKFCIRSKVLIDKIPGQITKIYLRKKLGEKIGIIEEYQLEKIVPIFQKQKKEIKKIKKTTMRMLISLLIQNPAISQIIPNLSELKLIKLPGISLFLDILYNCKKNKNINTGQLIELYRNSKKKNILLKLIQWDNMIIKKEIKNVFLDNLINLYNTALRNRQELLILKDRIKNLNVSEKKELWLINKELVN
ncbi:DNA primase [Buchnera aphidicola (Mindarus keteleerifoliae)]|uniref:DNA primase n=1 Tax=Buchnera aphidicola TaxID=9 RepID=UPI0031B685D4